MSLTSYQAAPSRDKDAMSRTPVLVGEKPASSFDIMNRLIGVSSDLRRPGSVLLSHTLRCSTIGAEAFHGRVRNGIGCYILAITTRSSEIRRNNQGLQDPYFDFYLFCICKFPVGKFAGFRIGA